MGDGILGVVEPHDNAGEWLSRVAPHSVGQWSATKHTVRPDLLTLGIFLLSTSGCMRRVVLCISIVVGMSLILFKLVFPLLIMQKYKKFQMLRAFLIFYIFIILCNDFKNY